MFVNVMISTINITLLESAVPGHLAWPNDDANHPNVVPIPEWQPHYLKPED